tara:strand:- start:7650 stop:8612 length:963 start_codon:yes stop_codon:yes gene_type:complete
MFESKNVLVTGGAGFIGSHISERLLKEGAHVRVLDNLSTGFYTKNIEPLIHRFGNKIEFVHGDITDLDTCRKTTKDIHIVCHQAAIGSVPRSVADPVTSHKNNVDGFFNMLVASKDNGIKRFVYASSSSVYGDHPILPKVEENTGNVLSPYAATKAIDELYAGVFSRCYDMECIGLRYFNIFGPRQNPDGMYAAVIPKFIESMRTFEQPIINGDGSYSRDFTYVDNAVSANILAMTTENSDAFGTSFNIGAGGRITILEMLEEIQHCMVCGIAPIFKDVRAGDIPHSNADISKAKEILGYSPNISFSEGIHNTINYYTNV